MQQFTFLPRAVLLTWLCTAANAFTTTTSSTARSLPAVLRSTAANSDAADLIQQVVAPGTGPALNLGDMATVQYTVRCTDTGRLVARGRNEKMVVGDASMIPAWEQALRQMSVGQRSLWQVPAALGYGAAGIPAVVPGNARLELDIAVQSASAATANIDFDRLAMADATPRTAADIQAAFEQRQREAALQQGEELEGLEAWIAKAKTFYFFGLFEGETGQQAPWFLRPSITFPLAFLVVGAAFYVTFLGGGIYERGAPVTDELDELIVQAVSTTMPYMG